MKFTNEMRYKDKNLIISNGTIMAYNVCIPIGAISEIKIRGKMKLSLNYFLILVIMGIILSFVPLLSLLGYLSIISGIIVLATQIVAIKLQKYALIIQVHSGNAYIFEHSDLRFIVKIADVVREALDDNKANIYIDMKEENVKQNINIGGSFYDFGENNSFRNIMTGEHAHYEEDSHATTNSNNTVKSNNTIVEITTDEWNKLEKYFRNRGEELRGNEQAYTACKEMERYAKQKDAKGLRKYFTSVGKGVLTAVLAKAAEYGLAEVFHKLASISI